MDERHRDNPKPKLLALPDAQPPSRIGAGSYGNVEELTVPVGDAAKKMFREHSEIPDYGIHKVSTQFVRECQLMSTLRHANIVHFMGICYVAAGSRLPALVTERLLTSLHDLLDPETQPPPGAPTPLSLFKLSVKCSVLHDVASGLHYLHNQTPPIIHRKLSAQNILLCSKLVAKIVDVDCIMPLMKADTTSIYMPPEAIVSFTCNTQKLKEDASIDIFSFGVVTIFTIGETFPCHLLTPNYVEDGGSLVARTELQRRSEYMKNINDKLGGEHPLIQLIQQCLHNSPHKRPNIHEVLHLLEEARAGIRDEESEKHKEELIQSLLSQPRNQVRIKSSLIIE